MLENLTQVNQHIQYAYEPCEVRTMLEHQMRDPGSWAKPPLTLGSRADEGWVR